MTSPLWLISTTQSFDSKLLLPHQILTDVFHELQAWAGMSSFKFNVMANYTLAKSRSETI